MYLSDKYLKLIEFNRRPLVLLSWLRNPNIFIKLVSSQTLQLFEMDKSQGCKIR